MAGVAQAYQHLLTINCLFLFGLCGRRVAVCIVELFVGKVTPFIALITGIPVVAHS